MKPPDEIRRDLVERWLKKAEEDFGVAELLLVEGSPFLSAAGFHLQQAAEKYLKALLVRHQAEFPKTHDLGKLLDLLAALDAPLAEALGEITRLDPYSVDARYPGDLPAAERAEIMEALSLTREVRNKVSAILAMYLRPFEPGEVKEEPLPEEPRANGPGPRRAAAPEASVETAVELPARNPPEESDAAD